MLCWYYFSYYWLIELTFSSCYSCSQFFRYIYLSKIRENIRCYCIENRLGNSWVSLVGSPDLFFDFGCGEWAANFWFCPVVRFLMRLFSLLVEVKYGSVLPLGYLHADRTCRYPGSPDAEVSGSHHCDGDPTLDIPSCLGVWFLPLFCEADVQAIQHGLRFCVHNAVNRYYGQFKVAPLLHTGFKLIKFLVPLYHLQSLLRL